MYRTIMLAALFAMATGAKAGDLSPLQAQSINLGSIHGIAYYTEEPDGYKVVTTLADGEMGLPVRFEATLADKQSVTISIPGKVGEPGQTLHISRAANKLVISNLPPASEEVTASTLLSPND